MCEDWEWDPKVGRVAMLYGVDRWEAARIIDARWERLEAKHAAEQAEAEARLAEIATQEETPITAEFAKKIAKKLDRGMNQRQRSDFRAAIGHDDKFWQRLANPQTREEAIQMMSLAQARRILGK